ncbi:protein HEG homolog 1 isoform X2 [Chelonia mydas]|uniref:protein HEG homolog 1 isoform X2 n=1 Tax=Chelonia mydas TaxID=8469 RepID=UPI001CA8A721|nr:protein HEG homolog 1 isoform X2 [Chelonia mydas]
MRATCTLLLRQLSLLLLLREPAAGSGPFASSSDPTARTQLSGATTPAAGPQGSSSRGVSAAAAAAAAAASRLPPWERESSVPWAPPVSGSTSEPAAGGHTSSPVIGSGYQTLRSSDIEMRTSSSPMDNMETLTTFSISGERTLLSITNSAMSTTATESTTSYTEMIRSSDLTQHSSSVEQNRRNSSSSEMYFTEPGTEPLTAHSSEIPTYSSSQSDPPAIGSSHKTASIWDMEKKTPSSHTDSLYISPTFSRGGERTIQLLTNSITSTNSLKSATSHSEIAMSSNLSHSSASISRSGGSNRSSTIADLPESSTGPLLIHSPLKSGLPAIEGSHQPVSVSEKNIASSHIASTYISATSTRAGEGMLQSLINSSRSSNAKGSSTSGTEMSSSLYLTQSSSISSIALTSGINISLAATDFTEPSTDPLLTPSHSASETASKAIGSSHQPINISATEKRTSDLHTTSTYISTSFTRGGERTLRSLMNSSTLPDVADSSTSDLENTKSSDLLQPSSPGAQAGGSNISSSDFTEPSTESLLTHSSKIPSYSSSPNDFAAIVRSNQAISSSATEKRTSVLHTTTPYISTTLIKGGERTLRSLTNGNVSPDAAESSTSNSENTKFSDLTQASTAVAQAGGSNTLSTDFTDPSTEALLTHSSKSSSYLSSPDDLAAIGSSHQPINISATETRTSNVHTSSTYISMTFTAGSERTLTSLTNSSSTLPDAAESSTSNLGNINSSDLPEPSSAVAQAGGNNISSSDFTEPSTEPLLTYSSKIPSYSSSPNDLAAIGSSHQPINISATETRTSDVHTSSTYISMTFTSGSERTLTSLTNSSTLPDAAESSTSNLGNINSSDLPEPSSAVAQAGGNNISSSDFTEPSTEPLLTHSSKIPSYSSSPNDLAGIGSSHQPISISATETRTSDAHTSSTYISTTSIRGEKRTLRSLTYSSTLPDVADSSTSYLENTKSSDLPQPSSAVAQAGGNNISSSDFTEPSTEPLLTHSSKIPSYSSSPNDLAGIGSSHQPISISATETRTSDAHTSSTYISTTSIRGEKRTLRSLTYSSTLPDVADSSTSYLENTKSSDLPQPSSAVAQAGGNNISSSDFTEPSTEPLLTHSSKIPSYSSSPNDLAGIGSSHQPISISATETRTSDAHTSSTYISTTSIRGEKRTLGSLTYSSTLPDVADSSTSYLENTKSSDLPQPSSAVAQAGGNNISSSDFTEPSTEPLLTHSSKIPSYSSSPNDLAGIGSSHQPISISATETRTSDAHTSSTYISTTSIRGEKRTLGSLTYSSTLPDVADSSTSYLENTKSSDLPQPSSAVAQAGGNNISSSDFTEPSTEPLLTHSSKIPSYSSSPNDLAGIGSSHQPISISATETRTSDAHTSSTYISTTSIRGEKRTLRSLTYSSTLPDVADSSTSYLENTKSSDLLQPSSAVAQAGGNNISSGDFIEPSTESLLTHSSKIPSYSSSPNDLAGIGSSHQPISILSTETRTSDLHTSSTYISTTSIRGEKRTLRSLTYSSTLPDVADSSTSYLENSKSSDLPEPSSSVAQAGGSNISSSDFTEPSTEPLRTHSSKIPSYSSSPNDLAAVESSHQPISVSATEKRTSDLHTTSTYISATFTRGGEKTFRSLTNSSTSPDAAESSTSILENTESSDLPQPSSSVAETGGSNISSSDFTEPSTEPLLTHSSKIPTHSSSSNDLAGVGSSHQSVTISDREKGISSSPTHSTYVSTTFTRGGERTSQSQTHSSTSTAATEISTHNIDAAKSSDSTQFLSSVSQAGGFNISSSDASFTELSTESLLTHSSKSSTLTLPNDTPTVGSNHQSLSSSKTEKKISSPYTDRMYSSATLTGGGERTSQSLTNSTSAHTTESSTSYTEIANSSELIQSPSMAQTRGTSISANDMGFTGSSTETFFIRSSKIPTYSSFQNDPSSIASSHQPVSSIDTEKRTSVSRTDSMYIPTTFSRGGDRTLLSISNNSTSAESSESSTFYAEISNSSDLAQSSSFMAQSRGSNMASSDGDLIAPSTEPLLVHSSKMPTYSSTVNLQNATLFFTGTESSLTGSSSLSSPVFPSSSSESSVHHLLSSTPSPPHSFASSESSLPSSSSVIPSLSLPPPSLPSSLSTSSSVASFPLLPSFSSSSLPSQAGDSFQTSGSMITSGGTDRMEPSTAVFYGSTPRQYSNHSRPHQLKESTTFKTKGPLPLQTEPMEQLSSSSSSTSASTLATESSTGGTFTSSGDHFEKTTLLLTTAAPSLSKDTQHTEMTKASTSILPNMTSQRDVFPAAELTTGKTVTLSTDMTFGPPRSVPTTDHSLTTKTRRVKTAVATTLAYITGVTTKTMETSTATSIKITEENIPATHPSKTSSPSKTTVGFSTTSAAATKPTTIALLSRTRALVTSSHTTVNICSTNPCLHDGRCVINGVMGKYQCKCSPAWQGEDCREDVDECLSNPCPALATCNNTHGSYVCRCPLGYQLEKGKCNLVRTFVGQVALKLNTTHGMYSELHRIEDEIITILNVSLSALPGYYNSVVKAARESNSVRVSVQTTFSLASNVTLRDIVNSVQSYISACKTPAEACQFISKYTLLPRVGGLCKQKDPECDRETSECTDWDGIAVCQCKSGYFKYNKMDHSCRACEDGYRLENEMCVRCPFGLGGLNCRNPYQLITVVIAAAGGGLLLILGIALIITCCRKNKNDISKLIFKSGDFQMSPYAEYPKNPRAQEWGRETIEMQENGSTKNLLQMTDVYYSVSIPGFHLYCLFCLMVQRYYILCYVRCGRMACNWPKKR